jgi:hypothetical protein
MTAGDEVERGAGRGSVEEGTWGIEACGKGSAGARSGRRKSGKGCVSELGSILFVSFVAELE